jgi:tRNA (guanine10-N2)-dimethyltransferase
MFLYTLKYSPESFDLCRLEMKVLYGVDIREKFFLSEIDIDPSRSQFSHEKLTIVYKGDSLGSLTDQILSNRFAAEGFRVNYLRLDGSSGDYQERLQWVREIGEAIDGDADIRNPRLFFGVTSLRGRWYFGTYEKNTYEWHRHNDKPFSYSNSLDIKLARSLVNLAAGSSSELTLIDPCCGVGTVVIEALSLGYQARGWEINKPVAFRAIRNLEHFGYHDVITWGDLHDIRDHYEVAIVDIPYGIYHEVTPEEQRAIILTTRRIANRMILVSWENMDGMVRDAGFAVLDKVMVPKGRMIRQVSICK